MSLNHDSSQKPPASRSEDEVVERTVYEQEIDQWEDLVWYVVNRFRGRLPASVSDEELHSAGMIGLMNAARSYDEDQGAQFKTYAYHRIRGAILDELRRMDFLPRTQREKAKREGREAPSMVSLPTDESGNELLGCEAPEASCENSELMDMMRSAMQELPEKMRIVMTLYYGESQSMRMIGERLNLTESRVSQIHSNAVARMRRRLNGKG